MAVTVFIPTALRQFAGDRAEVSVEAATVGEALDKVTGEHAELRRHLYGEHGALRNFVNVYVNDEDIRAAQRLETPVKDGDTVSIVPAIAGGAATEEKAQAVKTQDASSVKAEARSASWTSTWSTRQTCSGRSSTARRTWAGPKSSRRATG